MQIQISKKAGDELARNTNNIEFLKNTFSKNKMRQIKSQEEYARQIHRRRFVEILIVALLLLGYFGYSIISIHSETTAIKQKIEQKNKVLAKKKETNKKLQEQINQLKDRDYLDKIVRYRYSYSKDGEKIYDIPDEGVLSETQGNG